MQGALLGTPQYMAPEQARGEHGSIDARTDVYGLGATMYEVFTGKRPFTAGSRAELRQLHEEVTPSKPSSYVTGLNAAVERVILRCLAKDPDRRYQDATTLDKALAACDCAAQWTVERAEDWWRQYADGTGPAFAR